MVLFSVIENGEYGLLNPITRKLHRINETGKFIWEACDEPKDFMELTYLVSQNFEVPEDAQQGASPNDGEQEAEGCQGQGHCCLVH